MTISILNYKGSTPRTTGCFDDLTLVSSREDGVHFLVTKLQDFFKNQPDYQEMVMELSKELSKLGDVSHLTQRTLSSINKFPENDHVYFFASQRDNYILLILRDEQQAHVFEMMTVPENVNYQVNIKNDHLDWVSDIRFFKDDEELRQGLTHSVGLIEQNIKLEKHIKGSTKQFIKPENLNEFIESVIATQDEKQHIFYDLEYGKLVIQIVPLTF